MEPWEQKGIICLRFYNQWSGMLESGYLLQTKYEINEPAVVL